MAATWKVAVRILVRLLAGPRLSRNKTAEVLCLVVVNEPREKDGSPRKHPYYFGSQTGGPVAQEALQFAVEYLGVPPDREAD